MLINKIIHVKGLRSNCDLNYFCLSVQIESKNEEGFPKRVFGYLDTAEIEIIFKTENEYLVEKYPKHKLYLLKYIIQDIQNINEPPKYSFEWQLNEEEIKAAAELGLISNIQNLTKPIFCNINQGDSKITIENHNKHRHDGTHLFLDSNKVIYSSPKSTNNFLETKENFDKCKFEFEPFSTKYIASSRFIYPTYSYRNSFSEQRNKTDLIKIENSEIFESYLEAKEYILRSREGIFQKRNINEVVPSNQPFLEHRNHLDKVESSRFGYCYDEFIIPFHMNKGYPASRISALQILQLVIESRDYLIDCHFDIISEPDENNDYLQELEDLYIAYESELPDYYYEYEPDIENEFQSSNENQSVDELDKNKTKNINNFISTNDFVLKLRLWESYDTNEKDKFGLPFSIPFGFQPYKYSDSHFQ